MEAAAAGGTWVKQPAVALAIGMHAVTVAIHQNVPASRRRVDEAVDDGDSLAPERDHDKRRKLRTFPGEVVVAADGRERCQLAERTEHVWPHITGVDDGFRQVSGHEG